MDHNFNPEIILALLKSKVRTYQKQIGIIRFNIENIDKIIGAIEDCKERQEKINPRPMEQEIAVKMSRISCLENIKLEDFFSEILWL
ncbi:MAG: hypothetical protein PHC69_09810 [Ruminiclostridium sp.]|nr:hypothetical protein [Ruminiclostridium sp.]